jgi:hypothetical protein
VDTLKALCRIAFRQGDVEGLAGWSSAGEEKARALRYLYELALFLLWRALCARRAGQEDRARRLFRQATSQMARLGQPPDDSWYDALCAYHELGGQPEEAWRVRERQLERTRGRGQLATEADCRIKRCRLLASMGLPTQEEAHDARAAIARLREPSSYLAELERALSCA